MTHLAPRPALRALLPILAVLALMLALASGLRPALAQESLPLTSFSSAGKPMAAEEAFLLTAAAEGDAVRLTWQVIPGHYLYREFFRATAADGTELPLDLPPGTAKDDPGFGAMAIYYDAVSAALPAAAFPVTLTWQGCQDGGICYAPITRTIAADGAAAEPAQGLQMAESQGLVDGIAARGGAALVIASFFGFGLLLAFTPCVLPMVPILLGLLSRQGERLTPLRGAVLSGVYVLAMALAFGALGVAAALSGQNLQMVLQSPAALIAVAALFGVLALSSFGLFELSMPARLTAALTRPGTGRRGSLAGAAGLGFTSALIVGPCVTAPLAGALLYIAQTGDAVVGAAALFALGLGQGAPLLVAGTLGARALPRAGAWMEAVRRAFGFVFLGMAVWLLGRILPGPVVLALWALLALGLGVALGGVDAAGPRLRQRLAKVAGLTAIVAGAALGFGAAAGGSDPLRPLAPLVGGAPTAEALTFTTATGSAGIDRALAQANAPALVYVTADWCVTCRVIERDVLADPAVQAALEGRTLIKADVSDFGPEAQAMLDRLQSVGPPTMVFLDRVGAEAPGTRLIGDIKAADMLRSAGAAP